MSAEERYFTERNDAYPEFFCKHINKDERQSYPGSNPVFWRKRLCNPEYGELFNDWRFVMSRIGLVGDNSIEYVRILTDIWRNGNCAVLIDWRIPFDTAVKMMEEASVEMCYIEKGKWQENEGIKNNNFFVLYEKQSNSAEFLPDDVYSGFSENYGDGEAIILYSSGTTGSAKGIILSHHALNTNADAIIDYVQPQKDDCFYIVKPLSHASTITGELLVGLKRKVKLVVSPIIVPPRFVLNNINHFLATIVCMNPTLLSIYTRELERGSYSFSSLRAIYVSGSILSDKIYKSAHKAFEKIPIYNVYGLSEAAPRVSAQRKECCKSNSVGKPIKGVSIKIISETGYEVKNGELGVVFVKTPSLFSGYVTKNEKLPSYYLDWLNTGDIGYIDENEELHIAGRQDDVIIINSYKIYPSHIEEIVLAHKDVNECAVFLAAAFGLTCVYTTEATRDIQIEIKKMIKTKVASFERPSVFLAMANLPKTNNGKIDKNQLIKIIEGGRVAEDSMQMASTILNRRNTDDERDQYCAEKHYSICCKGD